jgi:protein-disulfide reductase (glutathione)
MINLEDNEEPSDPKFAPDGNYIPRIFFIDPNGNLRYDLYNQNGNPSYKYFYSDDAQGIIMIIIYSKHFLKLI